MTPVDPGVAIDGWVPVVYAKNQPEYTPLPALKSPDGRVLTRWRLSAEDLAALFAGDDVYLEVLTFNQPLQPVCLGVWRDRIACVEGA